MNPVWNLICALGIGVMAVVYLMDGRIFWGALLMMGALLNAVVYGLAVYWGKS